MGLLDLWMPILVSAVFVFLASSVLHMMLPFHRSDWGGLDNEEEILEAIGKAKPTPGEYMFPYCTDMKELLGEEMTAKYAKGPVGTMTIRPNGTPSMGKPLGQWFLMCIGVSILCGLLGSMALMPGSAFGSVAKFIGLAAFGMYGMGNLTNSIWKNVPWITTAKFLFDGAVYGVVTALGFAWLWPGIAA